MKFHTLFASHETNMGKWTLRQGFNTCFQSWKLISGFIILCQHLQSIFEVYRRCWSSSSNIFFGGGGILFFTGFIQGNKTHAVGFVWHEVLGLERVVAQARVHPTYLTNIRDLSDSSINLSRKFEGVGKSCNWPKKNILGAYTEQKHIWLRRKKGLRCCLRDRSC